MNENAMPRDDEVLKRRVLSRLTAHLNLTEDEQDRLEDILGESRKLDAEQAIFREGESYPHAVVILDGWAHRYKLLSDGRKQTFNFILPGETAGLAHALGKESAHTVEAITPARIATIDIDKLLKVAQEKPRLVVGLVWDEMREVAILQEHITSLGRRSALEALTHLILEIQTRLRRVGLANGSFVLPITQRHMADLLGLSEVHVSRTLQKLRERELIDIDRGKVVIHMQEEAEDLAEFERKYLN